jgi:polyisoprenoid-binding protein YceI
MKHLLAIVALLTIIAACTAPPESATRAQILTGDAVSGTAPVAIAGAQPTQPSDADTAAAAPEQPAAAMAQPDAALPDGVTSVPIDLAKSTFQFEGYGPGKSHKGTFTELSGQLYVRDGAIVGGEGIAQATSVKSDGERLENHLRSADFFDVAVYPEIRFKSVSLENSQLTGDLTFHGVTKTLTFPVTVTADSVAADFVISMKEFGIEYAGANDEVSIRFTFAK